MKCPHCYGDHPDGVKFCPITGKEILDKQLISDKSSGSCVCPNCSSPIQKNWSHCPNCSANLQIHNIRKKYKQRRPRDRSSIVIWVIVVILGLISCVVVVGILLNYFGIFSRSSLSEFEKQYGSSPTSQTLFGQDETEVIILFQSTEVAMGDQKQFIDDFLETNQSLTTAESTKEILSKSETPKPSATILLTITPTLTLTPVNNEKWEACPGLYLSRLHVDEKAKVAEDPPLSNRVRSYAGTNASILGYIKPGEKMKIIDGPVCVDNWIWWKIVSDATKLTGWTAEGDAENYWLVPIR